MRGFREVERNIEEEKRKEEERKEEENYRRIKPLNGTTYEEARLFVMGLFNQARES